MAHVRITLDVPEEHDFEQLGYLMRALVVLLHTCPWVTTTVATVDDDVLGAA